MPLTYQGPLSKKPARSLSHALREGRSRFDDIGCDQIDLRLLFETFGDLTNAFESVLGERSTWIDLSVYPTESFVAFAEPVIIDPRPSRISCIGTCQSVRIEVSIEHEQTYVRRFDERLCYEGSDQESVLVRVQAISGLGTMDQKPKLVEEIMHRFHLILSSYLDAQMLSELEDFSQSPVPPLDSGYLAADSGAHSKFDALHYQIQKTEKRVSSLALRVAKQHQAAVGEAWKRCVNQLVRLEQCHVRVARDLESLRVICQTLELYHDHNWSRKHGYGLSVHDYKPKQTANDDTDTLHAIAGTTAEWDVRWRGQWGEVIRPQSSRSSALSSRYVVRSSGDKSVDQLFIELPLDDADGPAFRSAQLELSGRFDERLAKRNAWQFEGPLQHSQAGQHNTALQANLADLVTSLPRESEVEYPDEAKAPNVLSTVFRVFRRKKNLSADFTELMVDQFAHKLPGFRYDQRAHISDDYFLEFYRTHEFGYDLIQIQRMRNPERFKVYLGASEFKVYLDDLSPTQNRVAPGLVVDFEHILPPGWLNEYHQYTPSNRRKTIELVIEHLSYFATPFFDGARPILRDHRHNLQHGAIL
jgi:hypothetical protein